MKSNVVLGLLGAAVLVGGFMFFRFKSNISSTVENPSIINSTAMRITSRAFADNQTIPDKYACTGEDVNPLLEFWNVPQRAKSLVLIVDDPDAPVGLWTHWTVWNIPPETHGIAENSFPKNSMQGITSANRSGYHGPCPPSGTHHYVFHLLALDSVLNLPPATQPPELWTAVDNHVLAQATLTGLYSKD